MSNYPDYNAALALFIAHKRGEKKWSMRDLARISGVSASTISRIEDCRGCSIDNAISIAVAFDLTPGEFFAEAFAIAEAP